MKTGFPPVLREPQKEKNPGEGKEQRRTGEGGVEAQDI